MDKNLHMTILIEREPFHVGVEKKCITSTFTRIQMRLCFNPRKRRKLHCNQYKMPISTVNAFKSPQGVNGVSNIAEELH